MSFLGDTVTHLLGNGGELQFCWGRRLQDRQDKNTPILEGLCRAVVSLSASAQSDQEGYGHTWSRAGGGMSFFLSAASCNEETHGSFKGSRQMAVCLPDGIRNIHLQLLRLP